jgi:peroxiredoxin (alkyl hydroperoxide reductase subunit C)
MENNVYKMPLLGEKAPSFTANTTQGVINFPEDYSGKWVILFSHPADFTPVCTTEFMTFGSMVREFEELNCKLVGLSIDSINSHIAWLRNIKTIEWGDKKNIDITFPVIDDLKMEVAKKYGMVQPGESTTAAVRAVFFVDPEGMIRTILYYPLSLGRNFDEIKRILQGLQKADSAKCATPADWRPGDDVIIPSVSTLEKANKRQEALNEGEYCLEWYLCFKKDR